jgi:hypothetical protein
MSVLLSFSSQTKIPFTLFFSFILFVRYLFIHFETNLIKRRRNTMNEIRQLCTTSSSPGKHLDEILALFHACPPQYLLPSLSLIGQSISCMSIEQLDINIVNHQLFLIIRQWSERLLQLWLINGTLNCDEHRALFYTHQLFKLLSEWLNQQDNLMTDNDNQEIIKQVMMDLFVDENFINTLCRVISQLITNENDEQHSSATSNLSVNIKKKFRWHASMQTRKKEFFKVSKDKYMNIRLFMSSIV